MQFHRLARRRRRRSGPCWTARGADALTGAWVHLHARCHTLQVDWTSGPATGTTAGSLRLLVDGVSAARCHRQHQHPAGRDGPARCVGRGHLDRDVLDDGHGVLRHLRLDPLHAALRQPPTAGAATPCAAPGAIREGAPCRSTTARQRPAGTSRGSPLTWVVLAAVVAARGAGRRRPRASPGPQAEPRAFPQSAAMEDALGVRFSRVAVVGDGGLITVTTSSSTPRRPPGSSPTATHPPVLRSEARDGGTHGCR